MMVKRVLFKLISIWLLYPEQSFSTVNWEEIIDDITDIKIKSNLSDFLKFYRSKPLLDLQENYVQTFDFNGHTNLYLTSSKTIDETKRGFYLAELIQTYKKAGFVINSTELPDYLPLFLEFASFCDEQLLFDLIKSYKCSIEEKFTSLQEKNSPYSLVFDALLRVIDSLLIKEVVT